jgi:hypothetical protein
MKFTSLLKTIIIEQSRFEVLMDKFVKPQKGSDKKPLLRKEDLFRLIDADPTTRKNDVDLSYYEISIEDMNRVNVGQYTPWLIKQYLNLFPKGEDEDRVTKREVERQVELFFEDLYKVSDDLTKFNRFKGRLAPELRDINKLTIRQLADAVGRFSLEKTKASKEEKKQAATTYEHPGGEVIFRGQEWTVVKISEKGDLGFDAACFYGGNNLKSGKGETNWCTSAPGLKWFHSYIKDGPLYIIIHNTPKSFKYSDITTGELSGLPAERYQFHFQSQQFMNPDDDQIDLVKFLNDNKELKKVFKPEFAKSLSIGGEKLIIDSFSHGVVGYFIRLYGLDDLIDYQPSTLKELQIQNGDRNDVTINIPDSIGRFKDLNVVLFDNCIESIPDSICNLSKLRFLALVNNQKLTEIPECVSDLPNLYFLNLKGSPNVKVPQSILTKGTDIGGGTWNLQD